MSENKNNDKQKNYLSKKDIIECEEKDPIHLTLCSGKQLRFRGYITFNSIINYQKVIAKNEDSRKAFLVLLKSLIFEPADEDITMTELESLSDDEIIKIGEKLIQSYPSLSMHYDKLSDPNFYERFKVALEDYNKEWANKLSKALPLKEMGDTIKKASSRLGKVLERHNSFSKITNFRPYESSFNIDGALKDFVHPSVTTNKLLDENIETQRDIALILKDVLEVQKGLLKSSKDSSRKSSIQNWFIIGMTLLLVFLTLLLVFPNIYQYILNLISSIR